MKVQFGKNKKEGDQESPRPSRDPIGSRFQIVIIISAFLFGLGSWIIYIIRTSHVETVRVRYAWGFVVGGAILGASLACSVAPTSFFESSAGEKWLGWIGTRKIWVARLVCVTFTLVAGAIYGAILWGILAQ